MTYSSTYDDLKICHPAPEDKWMLTDLWQDSFNDPPEYIEFFFNHVYKPENTLVIKRNGFVVSALQMIPYKVKFLQSILPAAYICGVCTHPFERGQGLMKELIASAKSELYSKGFSLAFLIPAEVSLYEYYIRAGFTQHLYQNTKSMDKNHPTFLNVKMNDYSFEDCTQEHFPFFDRLQNLRKRTILHDEQDFNSILQEYQHFEGKVIVALENQKPTGIAFAVKSSCSEAVIKDVLAENEHTHLALYKYTLQCFDVLVLRIHSPWENVFGSNLYGLYCFLKRPIYRFNFHASLVHD